jgi:scyllo-inositol 2-dehydrogenase (NADP+)
MPEPDAPPVRVGVVGLGNSGRHYHLPHIRSDARFELCGIATSRGGSADEFGVPWHAGWEPLLDHTGLELVVVATPHALHHPIASAALDRGISVLVEKPLTVTTAEADDLIRRAAASGAVLAVHHQRRWEADFAALTEIVRRGDIGAPWRIAAARGHQNDYVASTPERPHAGESALEWARSRRDGGGVMRVIGPHPIDHLLQLAGAPVRRVSARLSVAAGEEVERWAGIELDFGGPLSGRVEIFRRQGPPAPRFAVWGEDGAAVATDGRRVVIRPHDGDEYEIGGLTPSGVLGEEIYDDVFAAIRRGARLRASAEDARAVVRVIEAAERSAGQRGAWVPMDEEEAPKLQESRSL